MVRLRAGREEDAHPPKPEKKSKDRKIIHPGLERLATSDRCLKCNWYLDWFSAGFNKCLSIAVCDCGIWVMTGRLEIRWMRFSSDPFMIGSCLYAPKEKKVESVDSELETIDEEPLG